MSPEATPLRGGVMRSIGQGVAGGPVTTPAEVEKYYNIGRFDRVIEDCRGLLAETPRHRTQERRFLSFLLGNALIKLHRIAECDAFRIEAVLSGDIPDDSYENSLLKLSIEIFGGEYLPIVEETTRWLKSSDTLPLVVQAHFVFLRGKARYRLGDTKSALADIEFAHSVFSQKKIWTSVFLATNWLGLLAMIQGQLQMALGWYEKCLDLVEYLDVKEWIATNMLNLGVIYYKMGRLEDAESCLRKVFRLDHIQVIRRIMATIALGNVYRLQGEFDQAKRSLQDSLQMSRDHGFRREEVLSLEFLGDVERDNSQPQEARKRYAKALKLAMDLAPRGDLVMELLRREGECLDLQGRHDDAEATLQRALDLARGLGDKFEQGVILRCLGVNAANREEYAQAEQYFAMALKHLVKTQARHEEMILRLKMAQVYHSRIAEDHEVA